MRLLHEEGSRFPFYIFGRTGVSVRPTVQDKEVPVETDKRPCTPGQWLNRATAGIPFGPDRRAVRRELEAHLEDRAQDLRRIYPELTEQEARERASEIARKLVNEVYADLDLAAKVRVTVDSVTGNVSVASRS